MHFDCKNADALLDVGGEKAKRGIARNRYPTVMRSIDATSP
jgi:hypothetical protein